MTARDRGAASFDRDDDALLWGDVDDPTHAGGGSTDAAAAASPQAAATGPGAGDTAATEGAGTAEASSAAGSVLLVAYGMLAGVYLLSVIGWIATLPLDSYSSPVLAFEILYQLGQFLAIVSPVLLFAATVVLTRERVPVTRVVALTAGILVIAPWPLLLGTVA